MLTLFEGLRRAPELLKFIFCHLLLEVHYGGFCLDPVQFHPDLFHCLTGSGQLYRKESVQFGYASVDAEESASSDPHMFLLLPLRIPIGV